MPRFVATEYPSRVFGPDGDTIGHEFVTVDVLPGVFVNGSQVTADDFGGTGRHWAVKPNGNWA